MMLWGSMPGVNFARFRTHNIGYVNDYCIELNDIMSTIDFVIFITLQYKTLIAHFNKKNLFVSGSGYI